MHLRGLFCFEVIDLALQNLEPYFESFLYILWLEN